MHAFASQSENDTIVALSTPSGQAALAVVRLSGPKSRALLAQLNARAAQQPSHRLFKCTLRNQQQTLLDEAMSVCMHAPHSYTGEDVVELQLHGSPLLIDRLLAALVALGARPAQPGEFTRRAFENGKLDLMQAEAVQALIAAEDHEALQTSLHMLRGGLQAPLRALLQALQTVVARLQAICDFPEHLEQTPALPADFDADTVQAWRATLLRLLGNWDMRKPKLWQRQIVFCGPPNAGKSSLFNALLGQNRALVSEVAGTTRDAIEATWKSPWGQARLVDTAGLWETPPSDLDRGSNAITRDWMEQASALVWVVPIGAPLPASIASGAVVVGTKWDTVTAAEASAWQHQLDAQDVQCLGLVSVHQERGLLPLMQALWHLAEPMAQGLLVHWRQVECCSEALCRLEDCLAHLQHGQPLDMLLIDLQAAEQHIQQLLGEQTSDRLHLDAIFSTFCIGK